MGRADFHKQVNDLCENSEEEKFRRIGVTVHQMEAGSTKQEEVTQADLEDLTVAVVLPVFKAMTEQMRELSPPTEEVDTFDRVVNTLERDIQLTEKNPKRFIDGVAFSDGNKMAEQAGFVDCVF
jgi:hypothetical protein